MTTDAFVMTSSRPYLLRAVHEWITDNGLTPQIVVDARQDQVRVPTACVREGKIVLNISPTAVRGLSLGNEWVGIQRPFRRHSLRCGRAGARSACDHGSRERHGNVIPRIAGRSSTAGAAEEAQSESRQVTGGGAAR